VSQLILDFTFIPSATVFKLDIQMFRVEPERRHGGQQFSRESRNILSPARTDCFGPTLADAVAETHSAVVTQSHDSLGKAGSQWVRHRL
jgi:hypothetical protein